MNRILSGGLAGLAAVACVLSATPAAAQNHWRDRGPNRGNAAPHRWHTFGGRYGYNGYHGRWRTGQRFTNWNNRRYYIDDWRTYDLPPPRRGYRYYRDDNGDIVLAAIGTGIIASILASQVGR
jgi:Ni/Co efflux regulator RcnB